MSAVGPFLRRHAVLLFAFALLFPLLAYPPCRDSALYLVIGRMLNHGAVPYRDAWDIKPPIIYLLYSLPAGFSGDLMEAWYRLRVLDVLINLLAALCIGRVANRLLGRGAAIPAVTWYVALYTAQGPGVLGQTEVWANLFVFAGLLLLLEPPKWPRLSGFFCLGLLAGAAASLKPASCWPLLAAILAFPLLRPCPRPVRTLLLPTLSLLLGFVFINLPPWLWLNAKGGLPALRDMYDGFIKDYLAQGKAPFDKKFEFYLRAFTYQFIDFWPLLIWLFPGLMERRLWNQKTVLWVLAMAFAGFAAMWSQGRALNYHYQVLSAPAILIGTAGVLGISSRFLSKLPNRYRIIAATLPIVLFQVFHNGPRDLAALRWITGTLDPQSYARAFAMPIGHPGAADTVTAAQFIREHSQSSDKIMIWVNESELYVWANRLPANKYMHASGLVGVQSPQRWRTQYLRELSDFPPKYYIVVHGSEYTWLGAPPGDASSLFYNWKPLRSLVFSEYAPPMNFGHLQIYRFAPSR